VLKIICGYLQPRYSVAWLILGFDATVPSVLSAGSRQQREGRQRRGTAIGLGDRAGMLTARPVHKAARDVIFGYISGNYLVALPGGDVRDESRSAHVRDPARSIPTLVSDATQD
jgi:hypothetical protein